MPSTTEWLFSPFRLEPANSRLLRDGVAIALRPKTFAVLNYLVEQHGQVIDKNRLLDAVWGHRHVSESVLEGCISELRKALGDDARAPRYLETVSRRGYRSLCGRSTAQGRQRRRAYAATGVTQRVASLGRTGGAFAAFTCPVAGSAEWRTSTGVPERRSRARQDYLDRHVS